MFGRSFSMMMLCKSFLTLRWLVFFIIFDDWDPMYWAYNYMYGVLGLWFGIVVAGGVWLKASISETMLTEL